MGQNAEKLKSNAEKLYELLCVELADGPRRLDYNDLAKRLGCRRSTVRDCIGTLLDKELIGYKKAKVGEKGELYLIAG